MNYKDIEAALFPLGLKVIRVEKKAGAGLVFDDIMLDIACVMTAPWAESKADMRYTPSRILKSGNRTIVFWKDGTKTIVKRAEDEPDNDYAAYTAALGIKLYGSNSALKRIVKRTETQKPKKQKGE